MSDTVYAIEYKFEGAVHQTTVLGSATIGDLRRTLAKTLNLQEDTVKIIGLTGGKLPELSTVLSTLPKFKLPSSGSSTSAKPKPITINVVGSKADDLQLIQEEDTKLEVRKAVEEVEEQLEAERQAQFEEQRRELDRQRFEKMAEVRARQEEARRREMIDYERRNAERRHLDSLAEGEGTVCFTLAAYVTEQANASDRIYLPSSALTSALEAKASFPLAFRCTVASAGTYPPSVKLSDKDFSNETSLTSSSSSSDLGANSILPVMHPTLEPPRPSSSTSFPADGDEAKHPSSASTYAPPVRAAYASVADFDALEGAVKVPARLLAELGVDLPYPTVPLLGSIEPIDASDAFFPSSASLSSSSSSSTPSVARPDHHRPVTSGLSPPLWVTLTSFKLVPGKSAQFQPKSSRWFFLREEERASLLEFHLRKKLILAQGTEFTITHGSQMYGFIVRATSPAPIISLVDVELETEILPVAASTSTPSASPQASPALGPLSPSTGGGVGIGVGDAKMLRTSDTTTTMTTYDAFALDGSSNNAFMTAGTSSSSSSSSQQSLAASMIPISSVTSGSSSSGSSSSSSHLPDPVNIVDLSTPFSTPTSSSSFTNNRNESKGATNMSDAAGAGVEAGTGAGVEAGTGVWTSPAFTLQSKGDRAFFFFPITNPFVKSTLKLAISPSTSSSMTTSSSTPLARPGALGSSVRASSTSATAGGGGAAAAGDADLYVSFSDPHPNNVKYSLTRQNKGNKELVIDNSHPEFRPPCHAFVAVKAYSAPVTCILSLTNTIPSPSSSSPSSSPSSSSSSSSSTSSASSSTSTSSFSWRDDAKRSQGVDDDDNRDDDADDGATSMREGEDKCPNCRQWIPTHSMTLHSMQCRRQNHYCEDCRRVIPAAEKDKHAEQQHDINLRCACGFHGDQKTINQHQRTSCELRQVDCAFCNITITIKSKAEHQRECGVRTAQCAVCQNRFLRREMRFHISTTHGKKLEQISPKDWY